MPANCTENVQSWHWKQWHNSCSKAKQLISVWTPAGGCWESWVVAVCFYQALTFRLGSNCCEACLRDCVVLLLEWASSASCTLCKCNRFQNLTPSFQSATTELSKLWSLLQIATSLPVPAPFPFMGWWKTGTCLSALEATDLINRGEREEGQQLLRGMWLTPCLYAWDGCCWATVTGSRGSSSSWLQTFIDGICFDMFLTMVSLSDGKLFAFCGRSRLCSSTVGLELSPSPSLFPMSAHS